MNGICFPISINHDFSYHAKRDNYFQNVRSYANFRKTTCTLIAPESHWHDTKKLNILLWIWKCIFGIHTRDGLKRMLVEHSSPWTLTGHLIHLNTVITHFIQCLSGWDLLPAIQCELSTTVIQRADIYYTLNRYVIEVILYIIASRRYMQKHNLWKQAQRTCLSIRSFRGLCYWRG